MSLWSDQGRIWREMLCPPLCMCNWELVLITSFSAIGNWYLDIYDMSEGHDCSFTSGIEGFF